MYKKELVAVFGQPVAENPSEPMVQAAFDHHNLAWKYLTIEVASGDLGAAVLGARAMGFRGFNCTIPHKIDVCAHLDEIAPSASLIGAVNCVVRKGQKLIGENTDGRGLVEALRRVVSPQGKKIVLIGAGGAASAIAVELALAGIQSITIYNRTEQRGSALVSHLKSEAVQRHTDGFTATFVPLAEDINLSPNTDIIINATSVGLSPDADAELPISFSSLTARMVVVDVIPNPPNTRLVKRARAIGCRTIDGLEMLVEQGRIGVALWTGQNPDTGPMRDALKSNLEI